MRSKTRKLLVEGDAAATSSTQYMPREILPPPTTTNTNTSTNPNPYMPTNTSTNPNPYMPISNIDSSMAVTFFILLGALFFLGFFSVYLHRLAEQENTVEISRQRRQWPRIVHGVDPHIVQSLPKFAYSSSKEEEAMDCVVCLSDFEEKENVKMIPRCRHVFHPECIDMWLRCHDSCPLCRSTRLLLEKEEGKGRLDEDVRVIDLDRSTRVVSSSNMRRASSWSNLRNKVLLRRSLSV